LKNLYKKSEKWFDKLATVAMTILGNSITFIVALGLVTYWISELVFEHQDLHHCIGDVLLGFTFLSLFIIQKSFNRFSASVHLKVNELVASHEPARNTVIHVEDKTESEIAELAKEYVELALKANQDSGEQK